MRKEVGACCKMELNIVRLVCMYEEEGDVRSGHFLDIEPLRRVE